MAKEKKEIKLARNELRTISNLLFRGKFGFSAEENRQVITPLINKLAQILDQLK